TTLDRPVAIKVLPNTSTDGIAARDRFVDEAKAASRLNHPNIITVYAEERLDGDNVLVMEYVDGTTLAECLIREGALDILRATEFATQIASGLSAAHRAGIVHKDLSASNVLVSDNGWIKIIDFGLAASRTGEESVPVDEFAGTLAYMSPELVRGRLVDHRTDIWSFGVLFYEMLTGRHPFSEDNPHALAYAIANEQYPELKRHRPDVPDGLALLIGRCLQKDVTDRLADTDELVERLRLQLHQVQHDDIVRALAREQEGHSVAILPLNDLSPGAEYGYFCRGVTDAVREVLSHIKGLRIVPFTRTHAVATQNNDSFAVGRKLDVETVLSGSVRRQGDRVRVSVDFNSIRDGVHLWTEEFDRPVDEIFMIQERIVESVAHSLKLITRMYDGKRQASRETSSARAYDYYLRARAYFHHGRRKSLQYARELFHHATDVDPGYVLAHVGIANCCSLLIHFYGDTEDTTLKGADAESQIALELDPASPEAHAARGFLLWLMNRHGEADWEFETAIRLNPRLSEAYYLHGRSCFQRGKMAEAARLFQTASHLEDRHDYLYFAAQALTALGRDDDARVLYQATLDAVDRRLTLNPDDASAATMAAVSHCRLGNTQEGLAWADRAVEIDSQDARIMYNVACLFALEGDRERAVDYLLRAFRTGFAHSDWVDNDPDLDSIRDDERFKKWNRGRL
ncbi:MAG: protein kinase, partial [candidate division Zixibacteria bacterium]|nr:protein kinase [candidate division Zixibacteria bacterium]